MTPPLDEVHGPRTGVVAVVGPPGCGADLVTGALAAVGVGVVGRRGRALDVAAGDGDDPDAALARFAELVLSARQGTPWAPPELSPGWEEQAEVAALAPAASAALQAVLTRVSAERGSETAMVWFEPALGHVGVPRGVVLAWRGPEAAVEALDAEGIGAVPALALWEAYLVCAATAAHGLPMLGVDVEALGARPGGAAHELAGFLSGLGVDVSADATDRLTELLTRGGGSEETTQGGSVDDARRAGGHDVVEGADLVRARQRGLLVAASGVHPCWEPPADLGTGPWSDAVLGGLRAAHRSAGEAVTAWLATDEAQVAAAEVEAAIWPLRDQVLGLEAERASLASTLIRSDAARATAEHRAHAFHEAALQRDAMLVSRQWRIGRLIVGPFRRLRRLLWGR